MSKQWSEREQRHILDLIPLYRQTIEYKDLKESKRLTFELAEKIHQKFPDVQDLTVNAIYERLPYVENLLAGVFEAHHYAVKDRVHYSILPRNTGNKDPNLCNTRHKYNGAMTEYLKKMKELKV
ncbi:hypothetical protein ACT8ZR_01555 [Neobacillus sp. M.A.Huq-85]